MESIGGDEEEAILKIEVPCLLNLGAVYKSEKKIDNALAELTKVLEIQNGDKSDRDLAGYKDWFVTLISFLIHIYYLIILKHFMGNFTLFLKAG